MGSNPSSSSHTSFNWAWLPCGRESRGLMSKRSGSHRIKLENPLPPSLKCHCPQARKENYNSQQPLEIAGYIKRGLLPQCLLGVVVFRLLSCGAWKVGRGGGGVGMNGGPYRHIDFGVFSVPALLLFQLPLCLLSLLLSQGLQITASLVFLEHLVAFELFMMGCVVLGKVPGGLGKGRRSLSPHFYAQPLIPTSECQAFSSEPGPTSTCAGSYVPMSLLSHNT